MPLKKLVPIIITIAAIGGVAFYFFSERYTKKGEVNVELSKIKAEEGKNPDKISAYFESNQRVRNAIGLRYKLRVNENSSPTGKIVFNGLAFYNPDTGNGGYGDVYFLENNIFTRWVEYYDNQYNCVWPPQGINHPAEAGFWPAVSDYRRSGLVGARQVDDITRSMFPRQNSGIDNAPGLTKIETVSQMNINGKDIYVEVLRGGILNVTEPLDGWGYRWAEDPNNSGNYICQSKLPPAEYRTWKVTSFIDGMTYQHEFLMPESYAKYIHPDVKNLFTEFFKNSGFFQMYFWDIEFLKEDDPAWRPIRKWWVGTAYGGTDIKTNGFKLSTYNGHPVIEISNDGTDTYFKFGDIFELPSTTAIPPSSSQKSCSTGPIQACVDSISSNPVKQGQIVTFTGSAQSDDPSKQISKYKWRIDSTTGQSRLCKAEESIVCQVDTSAIPAGIHTIYFRVGTPKLLGFATEWSNWIGKQFVVEGTTISVQSSEAYLPTASPLTPTPTPTPIPIPTPPPPPPPPPLPSTVPTAPSDLRVAKQWLGNNNYKFTLTWKDNSNNETKFEVERISPSRKTIGVAANSTSYQETIQPPYGQAYYRVRACNASVCSSWALK